MIGSTEELVRLIRSMRNYRMIDLEIKRTNLMSSRWTDTAPLYNVVIRL